MYEDALANFVKGDVTKSAKPFTPATKDDGGNINFEAEEVTRWVGVFRSRISDCLRLIDHGDVEGSAQRIYDFYMNDGKELLRLLVRRHLFYRVLHAANLPVDLSEYRKMYTQQLAVNIKWMEYHYFLLRFPQYIISQNTPEQAIRKFYGAMDWVIDHLDKDPNEASKWNLGVALFKQFKPRVLNAVRQQIPKFVTQIVDQVQTIDLQKTLDVESLLDSSTGLDLSKFPIEFRPIFTESIDIYYNAVNFTIKRNMLAAAMSLSPDAEKVDLLVASLNEAGPGMQKLIQMLCSYLQVGKLKERIDQLKTNIKPMQRDELNKVLKAAFGSKNLKNVRFHIRAADGSSPNVYVAFSSFDPVPIGSASVGQVHEATLLTKNNEEFPVVVKLLRWKIKEKLQTEFEVLEIIKRKFPGFSSLIDRISESIMLEMDLGREFENLMTAKMFFENREKHVYVPDAIATFPINRDRNEPVRVIIMSKAPGIPLAKFRVKDLASAMALREAYGSFMRKWIKSALYTRDGIDYSFIHGDPHSGNLIFYYDETSTPKNLKYRMTVIDFGNAQRLLEKERRMLRNLTVGMQIMSPEETLKVMGYKGALNQIKDEPWKSMYNHLLKIFEVRNSNSLKSPTQIAAEVLAKALELKLDLPAALPLFLRAITLIVSYYQETLRRFESVYVKYPHSTIENPEVAATAYGLKLVGSKADSKSVKTTLRALGQDPVRTLRVALGRMKELARKGSEINSAASSDVDSR